MNRRYSVCFCLLIAVVVLNLSTSNAYEICQAHFDTYTGEYYNSFYCPNYCCGSCNNRSCCSSIKDRLNQYNCRYKCLRYRDLNNITRSQQSCDFGELCSGTCYNRYCSTYFYLNQNLCTNNVYDSEKSPLSIPILSIIIAGSVVFIVALIIAGVCIYNRKNRQNQTIVHYPVQSQNLSYTQPYPPNGQQIPGQQPPYNSYYPENNQYSSPYSQNTKW